MKYLVTVASIDDQCGGVYVVEAPDEATALAAIGEILPPNTILGSAYTPDDFIEYAQAAPEFICGETGGAE